MDRCPHQFPSACRSASDRATISRAFLDHLHCLRAVVPTSATGNDLYLALAWTVRDRLMQRWMQTSVTYDHTTQRKLCYLSAEYLPGPHLRNVLYSLGIEETVRTMLDDIGLNLDQVTNQEPEPGLGNGELGRLSACALDALATLAIPTIAYGIRYEFGLFEQTFCHGRQIERTEKWLHIGNPWEISRPELTYRIGFGGRTEYYYDANGGQRVRWLPERLVKGMAYDTPIPGFGVATVNLLRLWSAEAYESFDMQAFNLGDYQRAVEQKIASEAISKVLYLDDEPTQERGHRLEQHYFLVSCAMQDMLRMYQQRNVDLSGLAEAFAIQINDAHPALAVAELMRLLIDEHTLGWDDAWAVVHSSSAYTGHSLLPEALECWPIELFGAILPRHLEIIYEINHRFLKKVSARWPDDPSRAASLSLIDEQSGKRVRMAHLACTASHCISGVADLHSQAPRDPVLRNFYELEPQQFVRITSVVSHRRFLALANPALAKLITEAIGASWLRNLEYIQDLIPLAEDQGFRAAWRAIKYANKQRLAEDAKAMTGVELDPGSLFDIQVKRIQEYKRQHLNILHVISRYLEIKHNQATFTPSRVWIYAGKAAPGAFLAQLMIELILGVAKVVNNDPDVAGQMRLAFLPNFGVKDAERIYPAADLSEQITTAGKEPSGAGAIKFALNGALTIGTADGINVGIQAAVGAEHFFSFGLSEPQIRQQRASGYQPRELYMADPKIHAVLDAIATGSFSSGDQNRFRPLLDALLNWDAPFVLADFNSYSQCQRQVDLAWADQETWIRSSILNTAGCSSFLPIRRFNTAVNVSGRYNHCMCLWVTGDE